MRAGNPSRHIFVAPLITAMGAWVGVACSAGSAPGSAPPVAGSGDEDGESIPADTGTPGPADTPGLGPVAAAPSGMFLESDDVETSPAVETRRRGLLEKQVTCDGDGTTTISGTVYIPSGAMPVYNAMVFVPDANLQAMEQGASCGCQISGHPIATALTDSAGRFVLTNAPVGDDIPLVVQVGDWRREFNIGTVEACSDTPVPDQTLKLPAKQSEGDMPRIAVATGINDALECLVRKLGIDQSEFTSPGGPGRVQLFSGDEYGTNQYAESWDNGLAFPPAEYLWGNLEYLQPFDVVLLSCDAIKDNTENKSPEARQAMYDYLNLGGRVFGSHFQEVWFEHGPEEFPELATFADESLGDLAAQVITSFPKGQALAEWLVNTGASEVLGEIPIRSAQNSIIRENPAYAQRWIATAEPDSVQYISANTPLGASDENQCGRLVLSDIHVSPSGPTDDQSHRSLNFPEGCRTEGFSPQEMVLAFMLFDITSCLVPDDQAPIAPPPIY